jgi:hypothetical protein
MNAFLYFSTHPGLFRYWSVSPFIECRHELPYLPPGNLRLFGDEFYPGVQKVSLLRLLQLLLEI